MAAMKWVEGSPEDERGHDGIGLRAELGYRDLRLHNLSGVVFRDADLEGADLRGVDLRDADLWGARIGKANLRGANLTGANLIFADLHYADLRGANLRGAMLRDANLHGAGLESADLQDADLERAYLEYASLDGANLKGVELRWADLRWASFEGAELRGAHLESTFLCNLDLSPFCGCYLRHSAGSVIDHRSILRSHRAPGIRQLLLDCGMPWQFVDYSLAVARSMDPNMVFSLLQSTFISYGGPDEPFARKLNEALKRERVTTFYAPDDAKWGEDLQQELARRIGDTDRVVLVCSRASLEREWVEYEIERTLARERRDRRSYLLPVTLDDYVFGGWAPKDAVVKELVLERVIGDFMGADTDDAVFDAQLPRLLEALRKRRATPDGEAE